MMYTHHAFDSPQIAPSICTYIQRSLLQSRPALLLPQDVKLHLDPSKRRCKMLAGVRTELNSRLAHFSPWCSCMPRCAAFLDQLHPQIPFEWDAMMQGAAKGSQLLFSPLGELLCKYIFSPVFTLKVHLGAP